MKMSIKKSAAKKSPAKKSTPKAAKPAAKPPKREPKQASLPTMENRALADIEAAAEEYAETRDNRQALLVHEVELKDDLKALMHQHRLTTYKRNGIEIKLVMETENIKVKIKPGGADEKEDVVMQREPEGVPDEGGEPDGSEDAFEASAE
jgi:hypothetical protein